MSSDSEDFLLFLLLSFPIFSLFLLKFLVEILPLLGLRGPGEPDKVHDSNRPRDQALVSVYWNQLELSRQFLGKLQPRDNQSEGALQPCASLRELEIASSTLQLKNP